MVWYRVYTKTFLNDHFKMYYSISHVRNYGFWWPVYLLIKQQVGPFFCLWKKVRQNESLSLGLGEGTTHSPSLMMMTSILDPSPITIFWVWNFGNRSFFTRPLPFDLPAPLISMSNYVRCNCRSLIEAVKLAIISPTIVFCSKVVQFFFLLIVNCRLVFLKYHYLAGNWGSSH